MTSAPSPGPDWPPWLNVESLPRTEIEIAINISTRLLSFNGYLQAFRSAVQLFDFCQTEYGRKIGGGWQTIAGRDGANTLWHVGKSMETIRARLQKTACPTLVSLVDFSQTREAIRQFKAAFPEFYGLRIALAHSGEISADMHHGVSGPLSKLGITFNAGSTTFFENCFVGRSFAATFEGKLLSYDISMDSLNQLDRIKKIFFSAFVGAAEELTRRSSSGGAAGPREPV